MRTWMLLATMMGCSGEGTDVPDTDSDTDDSDTDDSDTGDSDTGADTDADTDVPPGLIPDEGVWIPSDFVTVTDPCNIANFADPQDFLPASLSVSDASSAGFNLGETGGVSQRCTLANGEYTCERFERQEDTGVGATLVLDIGLNGSVVSETVMDGELGLSATCTGSGCALLELGGFVFPCAYEGAFDLTAQ